MLSWEPEDRQEWQRTREWHSVVAQSVGFHKTTSAANAPTELVDAVAQDYRAVLALGGVRPVAQGGCHCGALRYSLWETPRDLTICHCSICRSTSGAPHLGWGSVRRDAFKQTGEATQYQSSKGCVRQFCPNCGTQISFSEAGRPEEIDFTLASLDEAEHYKPITALHTDFRLTWDAVAAGRLALSNHRMADLP
ncbi:GFA family protein [Litoreibacter janthinus]|nr:GFA family protein [Litoreibacter janthinus]